MSLAAGLDCALVVFEVVSRLSSDDDDDSLSEMVFLTSVYGYHNRSRVEIACL